MSFKYEVNPLCDCGMNEDFQVVETRFIVRKFKKHDAAVGEPQYNHSANMAIVLKCPSCGNRMIIYINRLDTDQDHENLQIK